MRSFARFVGLAFGWVSLVGAPWGDAAAIVPAAKPSPVVTEIGAAPAFGQAPSAPEASSSCGCETVVIDAVNRVSDADIRSGDASAVNLNVTYVSLGYVQSIADEIEVEIEQEANAISGDAHGGQTVGLDIEEGGRCKNVLVRVVNVLDDVEVRSGDATAINENIVLLDPGVDPAVLDLDVDQEADAEVGEASAAQVVGLVGSTAGRCGAGSVSIDAVSRGEDVDVESGEAYAENINTIETCGALGCVAELRALVGRVDAVNMCEPSGCRNVGAGELAGLLGPTLPAVAPVPEIDVPLEVVTPTAEGPDEDARTHGSSEEPAPEGASASSDPGPEESPDEV